MNNNVRNLSIKHKLLLTLILPGLISVVFAGLFLLVLENSEFQTTIRNDLSTLATIVGNRSTAALLFHDVKLAEENLTVLNTLPAVQGTCLYTPKGEVFAKVFKEKNTAELCPININKESTQFKDVHLYVVQPIIVDSDLQGTLFIHADFGDAYWKKLQFTGLLFAVLVGVSILTFFLSSPLIRMISTPISKLLNTVNIITRTQDYTLRAVKINNDEIGTLVDAFNMLICTVETQNNSITQARNRYLILYNDNPTMIFNLHRDGNIISVNLSGAQQIGLDAEALQDYSIYDFIYKEDIVIIDTLLAFCETSPTVIHKQGFRIVCSENHIIWVRGAMRVFENEHRLKSLLLVCEDITDAHELSEQILYQASHDVLTGLANRMEFDTQITKALEQINVDKTILQEHAICYLDLDQFKVVNDTCGHMAGDELLRQLGDLLRKSVRRYDFVARLGGDEFGILMYNSTLAEAAATCEKIKDIVKDFQFAWQNKCFTVGVSIGVTAINKLSTNAVDVLVEADAACYAAKDKGRNRVHVFSPDDKELALRHGEMQWVLRIKEGIQQQRFLLYAQPIVSIENNEAGVHFETLIRYIDDNGILIPPGAFLPAAERYSLAPTLDRLIITRMFEWLATNRPFMSKIALCSINLSGLSLSDELMLNFISTEFTRWDIPKDKICFEITETAAIANLVNAIKFIEALRASGCKFSLDDFGSGLSSFAYLKNLPVDFIKIDGLFVKDIVDDQVDLSMVKAINEVAHIMNKHTIAEFVENVEIYNMLKKLKIDYVQGYYISKPIPIDDLIALQPFHER